MWSWAVITSRKVGSKTRLVRLGQTSWRSRRLRRNAEQGKRFIRREFTITSASIREVGGQHLQNTAPGDAIATPDGCAVPPEMARVGARTTPKPKRSIISTRRGRRGKAAHRIGVLRRSSIPGGRSR